MLRSITIRLFVIVALSCAVVACEESSPSGTQASGDVETPASDAVGSSADAVDSAECEPQCAGRDCGDDGCGGTCGACSDGTSCGAAGQCGCAPDCEGRECGDDGCGASCGACEPGSTCDGTECVCAPNCGLKVCGDDGCGGSCGTCETGSACEAGQCSCTVDCEGKLCGDDGCGGSCGACEAGEQCDDTGQCECAPQCESKNCGEDGCGGICGECSDAEVCADGSCCTPDCGGKECGDDGCGGSCGGCPEELSACVGGVCQEPCVPQCDGLECGSDGCGGACGICDAGTPVCVQGQCKEICTACTVSGTVFYPNGTLPVDGALVYLTLDELEPLPDFVYCDTCTQLSFFGKPLDLSNVDGEFKIFVPAPGEYSLVVEKGAFRRVSTVTVTNFSQVKVPAVDSTLPKVTNEATGDHTPSIAVVEDSFDSIEDTLEKLGLESVFSGGVAPTVDLYDAFGAASFFSEWSNLMQYQMIFFPCDTDWFGDTLANPTVVDTLRSYVEAGGKLYVTDWSYDIMKEVFPEPMSWENDDGTTDSAQVPSYDAPAEAVDPELAAWLASQGITSLEIESNYTVLASTSDFEAPDADGDLTTMTPKVWVEADVSGYGKRPSTVTFQYGCGRGMFSTYHTEGFGGASLLPQELALAYILLEFSSCAPTKEVPTP